MNEKSASPSPHDLLHAAHKAVNREPLLALSAHFTVRSRAHDELGTAVESVVGFDWEINRSKRLAHLTVSEHHSHTSSRTEIYYSGDVQYVRAEGRWIKNKVAPEAVQRIFCTGDSASIANLSSFADRPFEISENRAAGTYTLTSVIGREEFAKAISLEGPAMDALGGLDEVRFELEIDRGNFFPYSLGVEGCGSCGSGKEQVTHHQAGQMKIRRLNPDFSIRIPTEAMAAPQIPGTEAVGLASAEAAFACWCTGCAACTACVACAACIACVACIFPPALAPVTASAATSAILAATAVAVSASTGIATAIQQGQ